MFQRNSNTRSILEGLQDVRSFITETTLNDNELSILSELNPPLPNIENQQVSESTIKIKLGKVLYLATAHLYQHQVELDDIRLKNPQHHATDLQTMYRHLVKRFPPFTINQTEKGFTIQSEEELTPAVYKTLCDRLELSYGWRDAFSKKNYEAQTSKKRPTPEISSEPAQDLPRAINSNESSFKSILESKLQSATTYITLTKRSKTPSEKKNCIDQAIALYKDISPEDLITNTNELQSLQRLKHETKAILFNLFYNALLVQPENQIEERYTYATNALNLKFQPHSLDEYFRYNRILIWESTLLIKKSDDSASPLYKLTALQSAEQCCLIVRDYFSPFMNRSLSSFNSFEILVLHTYRHMQRCLSAIYQRLDTLLYGEEKQNNSAKLLHCHSVIIHFLLNIYNDKPKFIVLPFCHLLQSLLNQFNDPSHPDFMRAVVLRHKTFIKLFSLEELWKNKTALEIHEFTNDLINDLKFNIETFDSTLINQDVKNNLMNCEQALRTSEENYRKINSLNLSPLRASSTFNAQRDTPQQVGSDWDFDKPYLLP